MGIVSRLPLLNLACICSIVICCQHCYLASVREGTRGDCLKAVDFKVVIEDFSRNTWDQCSSRSDESLVGNVSPSLKSGICYSCSRATNPTQCTRHTTHQLNCTSMRQTTSTCN